MGNRVVLDAEDAFEVFKLSLEPKEITEYTKETGNSYITVLSGQGIVTIDTVDFRVRAPHTLFIASGSERLVANTSTSDRLVLVEISHKA